VRSAFNIALCLCDCKVTENKQKYKFSVVYEAGIMAELASITQAP